MWIIKKPLDYLEVVATINSNPKKFDIFRKIKSYSGIVENVSETIGRSLFASLSKESIKLLKNLELTEKIGQPRTFDYSGINISPTTIRYVKILEEINFLTKNFHEVKKIAEIGVGYGGQARVICEFLKHNNKNLKEYTFIDLYEVLNLANKYLDNFNFDNTCLFKTKSELNNYHANSFYEYDLVISNYAFSEFSRSLQKEYIEKVFLKSKSGFILMNNGKTDKNGKHLCGKYGNSESMLDIELIKILPNCRITPSSLATNEVYCLFFEK